MKIAVHPVSRFVADYGRSVGVDWPQCILPLGPRPKKSEIASFKSIPNSENITIGTIARLDPIKRLELFRDVVTMGKWNGIVVCPEPQTSAEMAVLQSLTESENIEVIHTANASNQIAKFDIFLSTSISESLGLSHLEALQFGKPVLTTALHGPPEFMSGPLQIGILKDSDPAELVKQIRTAISAYQVTVADYSRHAARELAARGPHACAMQILGSSS
ncbi:glycosyltransferase [Arthrobacter sp. ERGS1:01]|uniref:glycosyltransferase n=1 Tax=Arthrobacter sp. ERGS1:01 TaxID=1704044 RepID=UPI001364C90C